MKANEANAEALVDIELKLCKLRALAPTLRDDAHFRKVLAALDAEDDPEIRAILRGAVIPYLSFTPRAVES